MPGQRLIAGAAERKAGAQLTTGEQLRLYRLVAGGMGFAKAGRCRRWRCVGGGARQVSRTKAKDIYEKMRRLGESELLALEMEAQEEKLESEWPQKTQEVRGVNRTVSGGDGSR